MVDEEREVATNTCPEMGDVRIKWISSESQKLITFFYSKVELLPRQQWVQEADSYFLFSQEKAEQRWKLDWIFFKWSLTLNCLVRVEPFERQAEEREVTDTVRKRFIFNLSGLNLFIWIQADFKIDFVKS